jgi:hypothetical protein
VASADPSGDEAENYSKLDISCNDVLRFWQLSKVRFSHRKSLARIAFAIPRTSTASQQVFSTIGQLSTQKEQY